jgi:hypothetical protein
MTPVITGIQTLVYDGSNNPNVHYHLTSGLTSGTSYTFNLVAINFNGESDPSPDAVFSACTTPSGLSQPVASATTQTTVLLTWTAPVSNGGCSITGYVLYVDDGTGTSGTFTATDTTTIANKPYLRSDTVTLSPSGSTFRAYIRAINSIGYINSNIMSFILASVPDTPSVAPVSDSTVTNSKQIKVTWTAPADDGGSDITSYELTMDNGSGGSYTSQVGYSSQYLKLYYTATSNITEGSYYRFKYRAKNIVGWSSYSPVAYILAATIPTAPPAPTYVSSTSTTISLSFSQTLDDGGSEVTLYKIYADAGNDFTSSYT